MLCKFCDDLDLTRAASEGGASHHESYSDLLASAERGCELCVAIQRQHEETIVDDDLYDSDKVVCRFAREDQSLYWQYRNCSDRDRLATFHVCTSKGKCVSVTQAAIWVSSSSST